MLFRSRLQAEQQKQVQDFQVVGNSSYGRFSLDSLLVLSYFLCYFTFFLFNISFIYGSNLVEDHIYVVFLYSRQVKRGSNSVKASLSLLKKFNTFPPNILLEIKIKNHNCYLASNQYF